jgi:hypothetical protein
LRGKEGGTLTSHERPNEEDLAEVACVRKTACECADEEEKEYLNGADPGYVTRWAVERCYIVGLEDSEGVDKAPGCSGLGLVIERRERYVAYQVFRITRWLNAAVES